jgi:hypothetical protein
MGCLCEFGLSVEADALVAVAAGELEVAVDAAHHEELLVLLRALRQRVELATGARGNDEFPRALGRASKECGRFDCYMRVRVRWCVCVSWRNC